MFTMKIQIITCLISFAVLIGGCATGGKDSILPQDGPTMKQVYQGHFTGITVDQQSVEDGSLSEEEIEEKEEKESENGSRSRSWSKSKDIDKTNSNSSQTQVITKLRTGLMINRHTNQTALSGYTRQAENEIQQLFPRLENKTLIMYIFPHLSRGERHPVPGYSTAFSFYEKTEYALPGEVTEGY